MSQETFQISKDLDLKIYALARDHYQNGKKAGSEHLPELKTLVSGSLDDGSPTSLVVKIRPNPINARLSSGWKVIAESRVWEIPPAELERSRLL